MTGPKSVSGSKSGGSDSDGNNGPKSGAIAMNVKSTRVLNKSASGTVPCNDANLAIPAHDSLLVSARTSLQKPAVQPCKKI